MQFKKDKYGYWVDVHWSSENKSREKYCNLKKVAVLHSIVERPANKINCLVDAHRSALRESFFVKCLSDERKFLLISNPRYSIALKLKIIVEKAANIKWKGFTNPLLILTLKSWLCFHKRTFLYLDILVIKKPFFSRWGGH